MDKEGHLTIAAEAEQQAPTVAYDNSDNEKAEAFVLCQLDSCLFAPVYGL